MENDVYVALGFHINFYRAWRGGTPDEAGFGTGMRVIRGILGILDRSNEAGRKGLSYRDTEVYWTFEEIIPKHCPNILGRMQRRVAPGLDGIILGPLNNGANHPATRDEFRAAVEWAIERPMGSELRQLFDKVAPFYRPQECMLTTGQEQILKDCGIDGLLLYYALVPSNTLGAFTPALFFEGRYNAFWYRSREPQPPKVIFPCLAAARTVLTCREKARGAPPASKTGPNVTPWTISADAAMVPWNCRSQAKFTIGSHHTPDASHARPLHNDPAFSYGGMRWDPSGGGLAFQRFRLTAPEARPEVFVLDVAAGDVTLIAEDAWTTAWQT